MKDKIDLILLDSIKSTLSNADKITVISHHAPDGDAISSSTALYAILKNAGHNVSIVIPSRLSDNLEFIPFSSDIIIYNKQTEIAENILKNSDVIFCTDFNSAKRVEKMENALLNSKAVKIMIDHHPQPDDFAKFIISDTSVSSASELVYEFITQAGYSKFINRDIAKCLYIGIMTDTINFSVNSEQTRTFEIASELLAFNIDKKEIYNNFYNSYSEERMRFSGYLLYEKMKIFKENNLAVIIVTKDELNKFNYKAGDHEGFVNMPLSIKSIETSIFVLEKNDYLKISLRSKSYFDVNVLARKYFNGGGHINAAGGKLYIKISEAEKYITDIFTNK